MRLFQPLGIEPEFLGHLDELLRGFRVLHSLGQPPGSVGLVSVVISLGHGSTFLDKYSLSQKGSMSGMGRQASSAVAGSGLVERMVRGARALRWAP